MGTRLLARLVLTLVVALGTTTVAVETAQAAARPSAPRSVTAVAGDGSVVVKWRPPASTGGSKISKYQLQRWIPERKRWIVARTVRSSARTATDTGLTNGRSYFHRVVARTKRAASRPSRQTSAVPRGLPGAVPDLEGTPLLGGLRVTWGVASGNGAAVTGYVVELSADGGRTWTATRRTAARTVTYDALQPGTRLRVRVRAVNAVGEGPDSGAGPYTPQAPPGQVLDLVATRTSPMATTISLTWREPVSGNGVPRPAGYLVERSVDGVDLPDPVTVSGATNVVVAAAPGVPTDVRVTAQAASGAGTPLSTGAPDVPGSVTLVHDEQSGLQRISWATPLSDGRSPLTRYEVARGDVDTVVATSPATPGSETTSLDVDGTAGTLRVRACNQLLRCSLWSVPVGPLPAAPATPTAETGVVGTTPSIALTWGVPPGPAVITGYRVQRRVQGETAWADVAQTTGSGTVSTTDTSALFATTYEYRVVAVSAAGAGAPSAAVTVSTGPAPSLGWTSPDLSVVEGDPATDVVLTLGRAPTSDVVVQLVSSDTTVVSVPSTVTVLAGQTSVLVPVTGVPDATTGDRTATVTATLGTLTADLPVTVSDPAPPPPVDP